MRTVTIKVGNAEIVVRNLQQALTAMSRIALPGRQADPEAEKVRWMLDQAIQGHCSNEAAYRAFETLADRRGLVAKVRPSKAMEAFQAMTTRKSGPVMH